MAKNKCFVFEVIDGDDILINSIIDIRYLQIGIFFMDFDIFKIANSIIRNVAKQSVVDELEVVVFGLKLRGKFFDNYWNIGIFIDCNRG